MNSTFVLGNSIKPVTLEDGVIRKVLAYSERVMLCEIYIPKGSIVKQHKHPHHQCSYIQSGKCQYTSDSETQELGAGDSVMIHENVPHNIVAVEDTVIIDTFSPMREDFIQS